MNLIKSQLNISHLKMICTIEQFDTVKEAAEALFITQPALTNRIREAERRLKTQLFTRRGRKLIITNSGRRLLQSATKILEELARAEYDIARISEGIGQVLRVSLPHYASFKWLPSVMNYFHQELPNIELEISAELGVEPLNALLKGNSDIAIISSPKKQLTLNNPDFESLLVMEDELLACLSTEHALANKKTLEAQDFTEQTYITNATLPEKDREYELFFKPANVVPQKVIQVGFNDAIIELIKVNMGLTIISKQLMKPFSDDKQLTTIKLGDEGLRIYWHLIYLKQPEIKSPAEILHKQIKGYIKESL